MIQLNWKCYFAAYLEGVEVGNKKSKEELMKVAERLDKWNEENQIPHGYLNVPKIDHKIPTHDPYTGELNPYYEELTGLKNPLRS